MPNAILEGFGNTDLQLSPQDLMPDISADIQQTLARILAFYEAGKLFKALRCDASGRLLVSNAEVASSIVYQSAVTVTTAETTILPANVNRKSWFLQNTGAFQFYLYFSTGLAVANALIIYPGDTFSNDSYVGTVYGKTGTGSASCRILEF